MDSTGEIFPALNLPEQLWADDLPSLNLPEKLLDSPKHLTPALIEAERPNICKQTAWDAADQTCKAYVCGGTPLACSRCRAIVATCAQHVTDVDQNMCISFLRCPETLGPELLARLASARRGQTLALPPVEVAGTVCRSIRIERDFHSASNARLLCLEPTHSRVILKFADVRQEAAIMEVLKHMNPGWTFITAALLGGSWNP